MKLGKLRGSIGSLLIASILSYPIQGAEISTNRQAVPKVQVVEDQISDGQEEKIQFMRQHGDAVNISVVKDNIKVTVEYMLADTYTAKLLISVEKLDGVPFKVSEGLQMDKVDLKSKKEVEQQAMMEAIPEETSFEERIKIMAQFNEGIKAFIQEDGTVDTEGLVANLTDTESITTGTSSASYGLCTTQENTDSKVYFTYEAIYWEPILEESVMQIESIMGEEEKIEDITSGIVSYLTSHQQDILMIKPNLIDEHDKAYLERMKQTDREHYLRLKEELDSQPKMLLDERGLGMHLIDSKEHFVVDNIGFVDGKLHIRMIGEDVNRYNVEVYNQAGEWVNASYNTGSSRTLEDGSVKREAYYVYDIGSVEEINQYNFKIKGKEVVEQWQGPWEIHLDMSHNTPLQIIELDEMIPYAEGKPLHLSEIHIGNGSIALVIDHIDSKLNNDNIGLKIVHKDGTESMLDNSGAAWHKKNQSTLVYDLGDCAREDVAAIKIGDKTLYDQAVYE